MLVSRNTPAFQSWFAKMQRDTDWELSIAEGSVYLKINKAKDGVLADIPFCFIDRLTGTILLAVNRKFPSKKFTRGNLFDASNGLDQMTPEGPKKMKAGCPKGFKYDHPRKIPIRQKKARLEPDGLIYENLPPLIRIPVTPGAMSPSFTSGILPVRIFSPREDEEEDFWQA